MAGLFGRARRYNAPMRTQTEESWRKSFLATLRKIQNEIGSIAERQAEQRGAEEPKPPSQPQRVSLSPIEFSEGTWKQYQGDQNKSYSLQRKAFRATVGTLGAVLIYSIVTFLQWQTMSRTYSEIQQQTASIKISAGAAESAATTAAAELRPWIKITGVELRPSIGPIKTLMFHFPLTGRVTPPMLQIRVKVENVGRSVAQDAEPIPELFLQAFSSSSWHDLVMHEEERFCKSVADREPSSGSTASVFPADPFEWNMGVGAAGAAGRGSAAAVIVCVNYRGSSGARYQTQNTSLLLENRSVLIDPGIDIDAALLRLDHDPSADHAR